MLILDEFHRLGKMSEVAEAMTTIRGFNGRMAIITQTIPKLDAIYSYEERLSIQGGAGLKLYLTPSEEMTIEDLSQACGMTTKRTVSKSRRTGLMERATVSERTEERPLLTEDEARRLPRDASIIIVNGEQPVKAKRIVHYEDPTFTRILKAQERLSWDGIERDLLTARIAKVERQVAGHAPAVESQHRPPDDTDLQRVKGLIEGAFAL
jgi:type IV secretion system protein VirD4